MKCEATLNAWNSQQPTRSTALRWQPDCPHHMNFSWLISFLRSWCMDCLTLQTLNSAVYFQFQPHIPPSGSQLVVSGKVINIVSKLKDWTLKWVNNPENSLLNQQGKYTSIRIIEYPLTCQSSNEARFNSCLQWLQWLTKFFNTFEKCCFAD